jgi:hypothetical protein
MGTGGGIVSNLAADGCRRRKEISPQSRKGREGIIGSRKEPLSLLSNGFIHGIGSKVDFSRPGNKTIGDTMEEGRGKMEEKFIRI